MAKGKTPVFNLGNFACVCISLSPFSANFRPSLTRAETIESCNSDDLVTVLEMHNRKPYKIFDRNRESKKGVMAESLEELISRGKKVREEESQFSFLPTSSSLRNESFHFLS